MKRILFVDDDANVLSGLRRGLFAMRNEWRMDFANNADEALDVLDSRRVDAIVTDVRMRHMDGFELLKQAKSLCPYAVRMALSGQTQQQDLQRSLAATHLFLSKPCDVDLLKRRIQSLLERRDRIGDDSLNNLLGELSGISSMPFVFADVMKEFKSSKPDGNRIAQLVATDIGMSATILHFVNSGYFGPSAVTSSPERAVRRLGVETVHDLIVRNRLCCSFDGTAFEYFDALTLWRKSLSRAASARDIAASHSKDSVVIDDAFAVGMFHDVGQMILANVLGQFYDTVIERSLSSGRPLWATERDLVGATHADVGAYVLALWGMPDSVVDAVARHHSVDDNDLQAFGPLAALNVAEELGHQNVCKIES